VAGCLVVKVGRRLDKLVDDVDVGLLAVEPPGPVVERQLAQLEAVRAAGQARRRRRRRRRRRVAVVAAPAEVEGKGVGGGRAGAAGVGRKTQGKVAVAGGGTCLPDDGWHEPGRVLVVQRGFVGVRLAEHLFNVPEGGGREGGRGEGGDAGVGPAPAGVHGRGVEVPGVGGARQGREAEVRWPVPRHGGPSPAICHYCCHYTGTREVAT